MAKAYTLEDSVLDDTRDDIREGKVEIGMVLAILELPDGQEGVAYYQSDCDDGLAIVKAWVERATPRLRPGEKLRVEETEVPYGLLTSYGEAPDPDWERED